MTLLLDTPVLLWALMAPQRLSPGLCAALMQPDNRLLLAQAQCEGAQLVMVDRALMDYPAPLRWIDDF